MNTLADFELLVCELESRMCLEKQSLRCACMTTGEMADFGGVGYGALPV